MNIFGVVGSATLESHSSCTSDAQVGCVPDGVGYKAARLANFVSGDVKSSVTIAGVAGTGISESHSACGSDGASNCVVNGTTYKAASMINAVAANIKSGVTIAGVSGGYPSAANRLAGTQATADLDTGTFNARMSSGTQFQWFDSAGNHYLNTGDPDIVPNYILSGVSIFGTAGTYAESTVSVANLSALPANNKVTLSWSAVGSGVIIVRRDGSAITWAPTQGTSYSTGALDANHTIVYKGSASTFDDTTVVSGTTYYYQAYAYVTGNAYSAPSAMISQLYYNGVMCGGPGDSCYNNASAIAAGVAMTPTGKNLEYYTNANSFKVWKEVSGSRILNADGFDNWAMKLNANGKGFSSTEFQSLGYIFWSCLPN